MKQPAPAPTPGGSPPAPDHETGLPGLRTWQAVYWFVTGVFVVVVGLLTVLTRMYS